MADIVNLNFRADGDFGPFIAQVNRAMAVLSKFRNEKLLDPNLGLDKAKFDAALYSFRDLIAQSGLYNSQVVNVTSSTEKFGKALAGQNLKLKEYYKAYVDFRRSTTGQIRMLAQEQVRIQNSVVKSLGRDIQGASKAMVITPTGIDALANATAIGRQEVMIFNKVLRDGATSLINWGKNTQWAGRQLTVGLTLPIMLFGKSAAEAFRKADQELTRLAKVYGGIGETSSAELAQVREDVTELSKTLAQTYGASFEETLALAADIAATGAEGADLLGATAETTRLATLGEVDRQEAMKATLALQSAFKLNTQELAESINLLNAVENQTSTTLQDLVEAIPKAGPVIKGLGGDVGTLALFLTAMREGGINAAEGANALKSGLASLINPTKQAVEKMQSFGININEIVNSNAGDLVGLIFDLQAALDKLDPLQKQQAIEQLFGKYQFARLGALLNNIGREGSQSLQVLDIVKASTEDLAATADRELTALTESASGRYKRALETFKASLAEFGEPFLDVFANIFKVGSKLLNIFEGMPKPIKMFLAGLGGLTALAGPLIMLTGLFGNFLGYIIKGVAGFRQLRSGAGAFELITTATVAADQVADAYTRSQYDQITATKLLRVELEKLEMAYYDIARAGMGGAPGPRPPGTGGGGGGGGIPPIVPVPTGGPMIAPGAPGVSGSARGAATAMTGFRENVSGLDDTAQRAVQRVRETTASMSPAEKRAYLERVALEQQQFLQEKGIGKNRASSVIMGPAAAAAGALGMMDPEGNISGMYRPGTGAERFNIFTSQSGHLFPGEKKTAGKNPATGGVLMPSWLNQKLGDAENQINLLTDEGLEQIAVQTEILKEQVASGMTSSQMEAANAPFREAKKEYLGTEGRPTDPAALERMLGGEEVVSTKPTTTGKPGDLKVTKTKTGQLQVRGANGKLVSQSSAEAKAAIEAFRAGEAGPKAATKTPTVAPIPTGQSMLDLDTLDEQNKKLDTTEKSTRKTAKNIRQSAAHAARFSGVVAGSVGTLGMVSSMVLGMNGSTNQLAINMSNFLMYAGFAVPAIQGLGSGFRAVGKTLGKNVGIVGMLGRALAFLGTGPGAIAIATIAAVGFGIKKLIDIHRETLAKARADISVTEEALAAFGGSALTAKDKFANYVKTVEALRQKLIDSQQSQGIPGLPSPEEIDKVEEQVKDLYKNQINRLKDISTKKEAMDFARNLKSTLVIQGVNEKTASAVIASIFEQAGKSTMSIPVLLDIAGITNAEQSREQLVKAAQKTFNEISKGLEGGTIKQKVAERFAEQLDLLSASALSQVKQFDDLKDIVNFLPEGMRNLTFEQMNATMAGQQLLQGIKDTNPELYEALKNAESLGAALQLTAAQSLGLSTTLGGVAGQISLAAQNAMQLVAATAYNQSGIQEYYNRLITGEQNAISKLRQRMKNELTAAERRKEAIDDAIEAEREKIDLVKEEADARRDALKEQQKSKDFELEIAQLRLKQDVAGRVGNFAEAAMLGLDIEKRMQDRSVDLAEKAIDDKEKREIDLHERKIKLLEEEKDKIKELTDEQKAAIETRYNKLIEKHNKAIQTYRDDAAKSAKTFTDLFNKAASGNVQAYKDLQKLLKDTGGELGLLGNTFNEFLKKTVSEFSKTFGDSLAALLGPDYRVIDGKIQKKTGTRPGTKGRGTRTVWSDVGTTAGLFGIKTGPQGMGPQGIVVDDEKIGAAINSISTKYGTFTIKKYPSGQSYIQFALAKDPTKTHDLYDLGGAAVDKSLIEGQFANWGYKVGDVVPRYMGGKVQKNYQIKAQAYNGVNTTRSAFPYLVGEKGPELFIPNMSGNVVPADRLMSAVRQLNNNGGAGADCNYYINVSVNNPGASADQIANAIEAKMRLMNQRVGYDRLVQA